MQPEVEHYMVQREQMLTDWTSAGEEERLAILLRMIEIDEIMEGIVREIASYA